MVDQCTRLETQLGTPLDHAPPEDGVLADEFPVGTAGRFVPSREPAGKLDITTAVCDVARLEEPRGTQHPDGPRPGAAQLEWLVRPGILRAS